MKLSIEATDKLENKDFHYELFVRSWIVNQEIFLNIDQTKKTKSLKQFSHFSSDDASKS